MLELQSNKHSQLSNVCLQCVIQQCIASLQKDWISTQRLITDLMNQGLVEPSYSPSPRNVPTSTTASEHPELFPCDKLHSSTPSQCQLNVQQLHCYLGFCLLKNWNQLIDIGQDTIDISAQSNNLSLELGDVANIKLSHQNKTPIPQHENHSYWIQGSVMSIPI